MPLPGIAEDSPVVRLNPKREPPLTCGFQAARGVFDNGGDLQTANHVHPLETTLANTRITMCFIRMSAFQDRPGSYRPIDDSTVTTFQDRLIFRAI